jgi:hypothetical protein
MRYMVYGGSIAGAGLLAGLILPALTRGARRTIAGSEFGKASGLERAGTLPQVCRSAIALQQTAPAPPAHTPWPAPPALPDTQYPTAATTPAAAVGEQCAGPARPPPLLRQQGRPIPGADQALDRIVVVQLDPRLGVQPRCCKPLPVTRDSCGAVVENQRPLRQPG